MTTEYSRIEFSKTPLKALQYRGNNLIRGNTFCKNDDDGIVVWKAGRIILNSDEPPALALDPVQLAVLNGVKVESVAFREQDGSGLELFVGLDDENYGGTMRPLKLDPFWLGDWLGCDD